MDDDWEKIADNPKIAKIPADVNKWAGEDEDDPKDSWEDALEDEKKDEEKADAPVKPKKTAQQRIAEKENAKKKLNEQKLKKDEEEAQLTPEEKLRLKKLQEEEYTRAALDTLGLASTNLDSFNPVTKEEFSEYADVLCKKISQFKAQEEYVPFLDDLVRNLLAGLSSANIRKIKITIDNLHLEKQKMEKGDKQKKKTSAAKVKTRLRVEDDDDYASRANYGGGAYEDDDYDDFM